MMIRDRRSYDSYLHTILIEDCDCHCLGESLRIFIYTPLGLSAKHEKQKLAQGMEGGMAPFCAP